MLLQDHLITNHGWHGEFFSPDKKFCRIGCYKGKQHFVPFRFLSRIFMKNKSAQISEVFKLNMIVKFSKELAIDDVFPGSLLSPPDYISPPANIYDFPFNKNLIIVDHGPHTLAVNDIETDTNWGVMYVGLTTPTLIEIYE